MATILIPLPARDYDPSEAAVSWRVLTQAGHHVVFATPDGKKASADPLMLTGEGLDVWSRIPGLNKLRLFGLMLRANRGARRDHRAMSQDPAYLEPIRWSEVSASAFDGLLLPGGHWARGMRSYLESDALQCHVAAFFAADKPVAAICHGVLLAARSRRADGRSVLYGKRTTALTWALEKSAWSLARITRFWDPHYYRTYLEQPGQATGYMSTQQEVTRALAKPADFIDVPKDAPDHWRKTSGLVRDSDSDDRAAFIVRDGNYISARWPGDVHRFAREFLGCIEAHRNTQ